MGDWGAGRAPPMVAPGGADPKRRRFGTPPRRPPPRPPPISVRFSGVPSEYSQETFEELHEAFGVSPQTVMTCEFLLGAGKQVPSCDVIVTYTDASSAKSAHDALNDQPVENFQGQVFNLKAKLVQSDPREARVLAGGRAEEQRPPPKDGPERIYPSVYLSDVPVEYTEDVIREMHTSFGLDADKIMGLKMLPSQGISFETTSCIMRYADQASAEAAVNTLRGQAVELPTGEVKRLGARMAKPARWMVEKGMTGEEDGEDVGGQQQIMPLPVAEDRPSKFKDTVDECGEGMHCIGKAGMLIFEDTESGRAFCEACFDAWEARTCLPVQDVKHEAREAWQW